MARVWPIGGRDSIGRPLRLSAAGPRRERQGLVWLMERRGRDREGLKGGVLKIEDVARSSNRIMQPPGILSSFLCRKSFPQRWLGNPGCGRPDAGSKPQPAGLGGAFLCQLAD